MSELRVDPYTGTAVHVVEARQDRPDLPSTGCPFCVGGLEAPEPYDVFWFPNRWPAMGGDRCEVVLYTSQHDATFWSLGVDGIRKVIDLWADRTTALGARDDVDFVLVFENRGPEVGATIAHPHGQIYAYDHVPDRPSRRLAAAWRPERIRAIALSRRSSVGPPMSRGRRSFPSSSRSLRPNGSLTSRRSAMPGATRWRTSSSTFSNGSTGCTSGPSPT